MVTKSSQKERPVDINASCLPVLWEVLVFVRPDVTDEFVSGFINSSSFS